MGLRFTSVVPADLAEVFAWHTRPGALSRLIPPWQPLRPVAEATDVRDGTAVLGLPGGLRWAAEHQADGYDAPYQFVDQVVSQPFAAAVPWRHTHRFTSEGQGSTRITDTVDTPVPGFLLRSMFRYRHNQLAEDLASAARARTWRGGPITVAVTGSSGLVGTAVCALLTTNGHRVIRLVRRPPRTRDERRWDPAAPAADLLAGVDALVHLAGASIAGRFTERHKENLRASRIGPTRLLAELAARSGVETFVCASAVGYYGNDRGEQALAEDSDRGDGFIADLVAEWEDAGRAGAGAGVRTVSVRTGIVQSPRGGTLRLLLPLFAAGLGGRIGSGRQWLSWIGIDDLADIYLRAVLDETLSGPVNAVAPNPVRNSEYAEVLASVLHRPALLPVPALGPRLLLGDQGAAELALASQQVLPARLAALEHRFRHPGLEVALRHLTGHRQLETAVR
ncbi:TIGR01777 family oxidoreductase [Amycolatopsis nivea]